MPAAAGGVDHLEAVVGMQSSVGQEPRFVPHLGQPELVDRRVERAVEDEFLDEDGRLQQRVFLACLLGEVLVEIAQESRVPLRVSEVVDEYTSIRIDSLEERDQGPGGVAAQPVREVADRVVLAEDLLRRGVLRQPVEDREQVVTVGLRRVGAKVQLVLVPRPLEPLAGASDLGGWDELVVFQEANEDTTQDPGGSHLRDRVGAPLLVALSGPIGGQGRRIILAQLPTVRRAPPPTHSVRGGQLRSS